MKATTANIWRTSVYLPYAQPPLTAEMVADAQEKLGRTLPTEYLDILRVQNGGYIRFGLEDRTHDFIRGIGPNGPNLLDFEWDAEVEDNVSFPLEGLVPFDGDGHWHLCLDYRSGDSPAVTYVDVECDGQERIADSFSGYLDALEPDFLQEFDWFVAPSVADFPAMKARLENAIGKEFEIESGDLESGPFSLVVRFGKSKKAPQSFVVQPNLTKRGSIRTRDPQYEELKDLLPGNVPKYPELPPDSYLFYARSDSQDALRKACEKAKVEIHPLPEYMEAITS